VLVLASPAVIWAQCTDPGAVIAYSDAMLRNVYVEGVTGQFVEIGVETAINSGGPCNPFVQSKGWIEGEGNSEQVAHPTRAILKNRQTFEAYGVYYGSSKHWFVFSHQDGYDYWKFRGSIRKFKKVGDRTVADSGDCLCSPILISLKR